MAMPSLQPVGSLRIYVNPGGISDILAFDVEPGQSVGELQTMVARFVSQPFYLVGAAVGRLPQHQTVQECGLRGGSMLQIVSEIAILSDQEENEEGGIRERSRSARALRDTGDANEHFNAPAEGWLPGRRFRSCYRSSDGRYTNDGEPRVYTVRFVMEPGKIKVF